MTEDEDEDEDEEGGHTVLLAHPTSDDRAVMTMESVSASLRTK